MKFIIIEFLKKNIFIFTLIDTDIIVSKINAEVDRFLIKKKENNNNNNKSRIK
jgi:hypothetical protein